MPAARGLVIPERCCGVLVDVQEFFLAQVDAPLRTKLETNTGHFARLLDIFRIPLLVTVENPLETKGLLPEAIAGRIGKNAATFDKNYFDLTRERKIAAHLRNLSKKQMIVAGCETDVCVLQSCLGLLRMGFEVFVVEELLFSSSPNVASAIERMKAAGVTFLTYKSLYYELMQAVGGGRYLRKLAADVAEFPPDVPDSLDEQLE